MLQISADLLAVSGEAALLTKFGKVVFSNVAACELLGQDCTGKTIKSLFGEEVAGIQASSYIGSISMNGQALMIRTASSDNLKAMFLSRPDGSTAHINEAFIFSLRSSQMTLGLSLDMARNHAQELNSPELLAAIASMTHEHFKINRTISNVSVINGSTYFALQKIDLSELLAEMIRSLKLMLKTTDIRFSAPEHLVIYADPNLIRILFMNLLSNAITHAHGYSRISVSLTEGSSSVMLSVDDDGCGIRPEELHMVFDRYMHSMSLSDMSFGSGFGLAASRTIAQLHDGTILLESRENAGTAVRVSLSRNPMSAHKLQSSHSYYDQPEQALLTGFAGCLPDEFFSEKYTD